MSNKQMSVAYEVVASKYAEWASEVHRQLENQAAQTVRFFPDPKEVRGAQIIANAVFDEARIHGDLLSAQDDKNIGDVVSLSRHFVVKEVWDEPHVYWAGKSPFFSPSSHNGVLMSPEGKLVTISYPNSRFGPAAMADELIEERLPAFIGDFLFSNEEEMLEAGQEWLNSSSIVRNWLEANPEIDPNFNKRLLRIKESMPSEAYPKPGSRLGR